MPDTDLAAQAVTKMTDRALPSRSSQAGRGHRSHANTGAKRKKSGGDQSYENRGTGWRVNGVCGQVTFKLISRECSQGQGRITAGGGNNKCTGPNVGLN